MMLFSASISFSYHHATPTKAKEGQQVFEFYSQTQGQKVGASV
jgi:hypothetical protein